MLKISGCGRKNSVLFSVLSYVCESQSKVKKKNATNDQFLEFFSISEPFLSLFPP